MKWPKVTRSEKKEPRFRKKSFKQKVVDASTENGWEVFEKTTLNYFDKYDVRVEAGEYQTVRQSDPHSFEGAYEKAWDSLRNRGLVKDPALEEKKIV